MIMSIMKIISIMKHENENVKKIMAIMSNSNK